MAMVKCPICGKMVSDKGLRCPNCDNNIEGNACCPYCNSGETEIATEVKESAFSKLFGGSKNKVYYNCKKCGKTFYKK